MPSKSIEQLDLSAFEAPKIDGNPRFLVRAFWYLINALFFQGAILGLLPNRLKATLLRLFGAQVGGNLVCKPRVSIKAPWFLEIGDHVWIGEGVWIDNHCLVKIGSSVCISQGVYIFTGNHDWYSKSFDFFCNSVTIEDSVWITAFQRVGPGSVILARTAIVPNKEKS